MADMQRRIEREERRLRKEKKRKIILWSVAAVIAIALVIMRVCEININSVIDRFTDEEGNLSLLDGVAEDNFPFTLDSSRNVVLTETNNKLCVLTPSSLTVINPTDGESEYTFAHGYSNPILEKSGIYTLVYDQGSKSYRLDTTSSEIYQETTDNTILCADVNRKGYVAVATNTSAKHCSIAMINDSLKPIFSTKISDGYVIDMEISDNGKRLAVATISSVDASLVTTVTIYNTSSEEKIGSVKLPSASLIDLHYNGYSLYAVGDSYVGVVDDDCEYTRVYKLGSISTVCYDYSSDDELVIVHSRFSNSNSNICSVVDSYGDVDTDIKLTGAVKDVSASSNKIMIQMTNKILAYSYRGEKSGKAECNDSIKSICALGTHVFCNRQTIIEKCEVSE